MSCGWKGSILFEVSPQSGNSSIILPIKQDICNFLAGSTLYTKLYVSFTKYSIEDKESSWKQLVLDLETSAFECGSPIYSNGGGKDCKSFNCNCMIKRKNNKRIKEHKMSRAAKGDFRRTSLINDIGNNSREKGKSMLRKTHTTIGSMSCNFGFSVKCDDLGFFISLGRKGGNPTHTNHPPPPVNIGSIPTRLISKKERETISFLGQSSCAVGIWQAYGMKRLGVFYLMLKYHISMIKVQMNHQVLLEVMEIVTTTNCWSIS